MAGKTIIGRVATISFLDADVVDVPARVDSGAYRSSIWATGIREQDGILYFTLLGPTSPYYSGKQLTTAIYKLVDVENSFGHRQKRYSVFLRIKVNGRVVKSNFTLANRSTKTYPALIGRKLLKNRFVVDVAISHSTTDDEMYGDESLE